MNSKLNIPARVTVFAVLTLLVIAAALTLPKLSFGPVFAQAVPPAAPTTLTAKAVGLQTIELVWVVSPGTIVGYKIQRSTTDDAVPEWVDVIADTGNDKRYYSDTHSSLAGKTNVKYRVAAINALNTGPYSAPSATATGGVSLPTAGSQPAPPTGLKAEVSPTTAGTVDLSWNAPARVGSATSGYTVEWSKDGKQPWLPTSVVPETSSDTATTHLQGTIPQGTMRYYRVAAINGAGTGPYTTAEVRVTTRPVGVPNVPLWLSLEADSAEPVRRTTVELAWLEPELEVTLPILGYKIERSTDGGTTWVVAKADTGNDKTYYSDTHSSLAGKTNVNYRVAAINSLGTGVFTAELTTSVRLPTAGREPGMPTGLEAVAIGGTMITVSWTAPAKANNDEGDISAYEVQWSEDGDRPWLNVTSRRPSSVTDPNHTDTVGPGERRYYRVAATNDAGTGPYTTAKVGEAAGMPAALAAAPAAVAVGVSTVELSWTPPINTTVTGYKIERSITDSATPKWVVANANTGSLKTYADNGTTKVSYSDTHSSLAGKTNVRYQVTVIGVRSMSTLPSPTSTPVALPVAGKQRPHRRG